VNYFKPPRIKTLFEIIMDNFNDTINLILLAAAIVSVIIGLFKEGWPRGLIEGISIMIALVIIITVTSANNWVSER
jgi:Ca2+-transporting ATPase